MGSTSTAAAQPVAHLIQGHHGSGITKAVRSLWHCMGRDMPLRIPHHTAGPEAMVGEVALAASGILFLDDILEFRTSTLRRTFAVWRQMHPKAQPILVIGLRLSDDQRSAEFEWPRIQRLAEDLPLIKHHLIAD